jgi:putative hemolysin
MEEFLIILFLLSSAFFSASETIFLSVNRIRLEGFRHRKRFGSGSAVWFLRRPSRFIFTTLIGTNLATIAFSSLFTAYLLNRGIPSGWIMPVSTVLVLVFGEIIPKSLGRDLADPGSLWVAPLLRFFDFLFLPMNRIARGISTIVLAVLGVRAEEVRRFFTKRDLEILIREGAQSGVIPSRKEWLIRRILRFRTLRARDVMTPRTEIAAIEVSEDLAEAAKIVQTTGFSKIPVYRDDIDHIIGVIYALDLIEGADCLKDLIKPIAFFPDQKKAWEILRELRRARQSISIIVDEWGGTSGLITTEDLLEELTGDIEDEYDPARFRIQQLDSDRWMVSGRMEVDEINRRFDLGIPEGDYETLGGYLIHVLQRIPKKGETVTIGDYRYEIVKATRTKVRIVIIQRVKSDED